MSWEILAAFTPELCSYVGPTAMSWERAWFRKLGGAIYRRAYRITRMAHHLIRFGGRRIYVDRSSWVSFWSVLKTNGGGEIRIGGNCEIHPTAMLLTYGGDIHIGDNVSVNPFTIIYGHGGVRIGNGVRIAAHSIIIPANHNPTSKVVPLHMSGTTAKGIVIEDDVWLGAGCRILDGVHISRGAIVGAGSVVTRSVPEEATVAGVPARALNQR